MTTGTRSYQLSKTHHSIIITHNRRHLEEVKIQYRNTSGAHDGEVLCRSCEAPINIGDQIVSKKWGKHWRTYYHSKCARRLNII